jgi:hypothetical protein
VGGVTDILRYPVLRSKTLIMYFNWFASSFMLYGLALNWQHLTGPLLYSVKFGRENPAGKYPISTGNFGALKIREIHSSQFIADCSRVRYAIR